MKRSTCALLVGLALCAPVATSQTPPHTASPALPSDRSSTAVPPAPPGTPLRFAVLGDTRDGHKTHRAIVADIVASGPNVVLQTGDLVSDGSVSAQWTIFDDITRTMRARSRYYPARGNHDAHGGELFARHIPTEGVHREGFYYSFDRGNIHFVAIDTEDSLVETSPQYHWLAADMTRARDAGRFVIPFFHKAIFSIGPHSAQPDVQALRPILHDLFRKIGVRLVFQGHDHQYYRSSRDGITYVVTGGGGAPLYGAAHPELRVPGDVFERVHHFCVGDAYRDRIVVTVYRVDSSRLDTFTVAVPSN